MSIHSQKAHLGRSAFKVKEEEYFQDSIDQEQPHHDEQYLKLKELCQKESFHLKHTKMVEEVKPASEEESKPRKGFTKIKFQAKSHESKGSHEDLSSSQYMPGSLFASDQDDQDCYEPEEKLDCESLKNLNYLIRKFEVELSGCQTKGKKIKDISKCLELSVDLVKSKVNEFFRRKKGVSPDSSKYEHQTIYKKTEMFDDAIRKVLKATPYACINDLREQIKKKLGLDLAKETLIRRLKNLKYNYKKFTIQKPQKSDPKIIELRKSYMQIYRQILKKEIPILYFGTVHMALDECRGSMWMKSKDNGEVDHILCEKDVVTITLILSTERVQFYHIYEGFYKQNTFFQAIKLWLSELSSNDETTLSLQPNKASLNLPAYLMIEGNLIHFRNGVLPDQLSSLLLSSKIVPIPFPCYSSSMNPAEVLFNQIKYVTRGKVKRSQTKELQECIESVIRNHIDLDDIRFAFRKVQEINKKY